MLCVGLPNWTNILCRTKKNDGIITIRYKRDPVKRIIARPSQLSFRSMWKKTSHESFSLKFSNLLTFWIEKSFGRCVKFSILRSYFFLKKTFNDWYLNWKKMPFITTTYLREKVTGWSIIKKNNYWIQIRDL